jgi:hypothetical protein
VILASSVRISLSWATAVNMRKVVQLVAAARLPRALPNRSVRTTDKVVRTTGEVAINNLGHQTQEP